MPRRRALREPRLRSHPGRKALAFHEAGHAIIGYLLGLEIEHVTINSTPRSLGHCRYRGWEDGMAPADLDLNLALVIAGAVAEEMVMLMPSRAADEQRALHLATARLVDGAAAAAHVAGVRRQVALMLDRHWPL